MAKFMNYGHWAVWSAKILKTTIQLIFWTRVPIFGGLTVFKSLLSRKGPNIVKIPHSLVDSFGEMVLVSPECGPTPAAGPAHTLNE